MVIGINNDIKNTNERQDLEEDDTMNAIAERPYTITESIIESCKEVKLMREGKRPKNSLQDLWNNIEKWKSDDEESTD